MKPCETQTRYEVNTINELKSINTCWHYKTRDPLHWLGQVSPDFELYNLKKGTI